MTILGLQEVGRFRASSADGQEFTIIEYVRLVDAGVKGDPNRTMPGLKLLRTSAGHHVNKIDDDTFEIVELGLRISRTE